MAHKSNSDNFENMARVGNFTKNAVENFEENIVNKKNYLEEVNSKKSRRFKPTEKRLSYEL